MALINPMAPIWSSEINQLGLRAEDVFTRAYASNMSRLAAQSRGYFSVEETYAIPELARTPKPRANRKLLLCQP